MDPECADDAKLMALTSVLAVGVFQMGRWIVLAVRSVRHGVVYDVEHYTAQLIAGENQIIQMRRRQKLQPIMIMS
jgi:prephenate dehydrogenase